MGERNASRGSSTAKGYRQEWNPSIFMSDKKKQVIELRPRFKTDRPVYLITQP